MKKLTWSKKIDYSKYLIWKYKDHKEYEECQISKYNANKDGKWCREEDVKFLYDEFLINRFKTIKMGICHGAKTGYENQLFTKYTGTRFIGTDIATSSDDVIEWDMHDIKDEWINNVDIIYTNSFDHTYKPIELLQAWIKCLSANGVIIIEWTWQHGRSGTSTSSDPLAADRHEYWEIITAAGGKKVTELGKFASKNNVGAPIDKYFLIVEKNVGE